jgi:hypothetical protein
MVALAAGEEACLHSALQATIERSFTRCDDTQGLLLAFGVLVCDTPERTLHRPAGLYSMLLLLPDLDMGL